MDGFIFVLFPYLAMKEIDFIYCMTNKFFEINLVFSCNWKHFQYNFISTTFYTYIQV